MCPRPLRQDFPKTRPTAKAANPAKQEESGPRTVPQPRRLPAPDRHPAARLFQKLSAFFLAFPIRDKPDDDTKKSSSATAPGQPPPPAASVPTAQAAIAPDSDNARTRHAKNAVSDAAPKAIIHNQKHYRLLTNGDDLTYQRHNKSAPLVIPMRVVVVTSSFGTGTPFAK